MPTHFDYASFKQRCMECTNNATCKAMMPFDIDVQTQTFVVQAFDKHFVDWYDVQRYVCVCREICMIIWRIYRQYWMCAIYVCISNERYN